jgi:hypothetical protein
MTIREKFEKNFFSDIHQRLVDYVSGNISTKLSDLDNPDIDEYYIQDAVKTILEHRIPKIDDSLKVVRNKSQLQIKTKVKELTGLDFNPQIDIRIVGDDYKMLYAAYEIKSRLQNNKLNKNDIYEDIQRLAVIKAIFPKVKCIFILPGLYQEMKEDFTDLDINIPNTFNILGNKNFQKKGRYFVIILNQNICETYSEILNKLRVLNIIIRLSQIGKGKKHVLFTYEISVKYTGH